MKKFQISNFKFQISKGDYQKGQVLLISLMVLVVVMVIGLSVAARTITTLHTTSAEDSSQKAFSAAEAGVERALTADVNSTLSGGLGNNANYVTTTSVLAGDEFLLNAGSFLLKDDSADIWLSSYPDYSSPWSGTLTLYWGSSSDACISSPESGNTMAALEIVFINGTKAAPTINTYAYDPCGVRRTNNFFSVPAGGGSLAGRSFAYSVSIPVSSGMLARVVPLYAGTYIGVSGTGMPPQGTVISSIGSSGGTQRKIVSFRGNPRAPSELFPFLIFSPK